MREMTEQLVIRRLSNATIGRAQLEQQVASCVDTLPVWTRLNIRRAFCRWSDVPSEPRNVSVTSASEKSISLRWDEPESDGGCDVTQYVVEMREGSRRTWQRAGVSSLADERRYTALALTAGQQYVFRVAAENRVGVGDWAEMTQSVTAKSAQGTTSHHHSMSSSSLASSLAAAAAVAASFIGPILWGHSVPLLSLIHI